MTMIETSQDKYYGWRNLLFLGLVILLAAQSIFLRVKFFRLFQPEVSAAVLIDLARVEAAFVIPIVFWCFATLIVIGSRDNVRRALVMFSALFLLGFNWVLNVSCALTHDLVTHDMVQYWLYYLYVSYVDPVPTVVPHSIFNLLVTLFHLIVVPSICWAMIFYWWRNASRTQVSQKKKKLFKKSVKIMFFIWLVNFVPPLQQEFPYGISHNSMIYSLKWVLSPPEDIFALDPKAAYPKATLKSIATKRSLDNVVIIILESTRQDVISFYGKNSYNLTPFIDSIAQQSLVATKAYSMIPHTSKALTAINCGIEPLMNRALFESSIGIGVDCLPTLLKRQGYKTAFFQTPTKTYENREELVKQLNFDKFYSQENLINDKYQIINNFGYEDDAVLEPSREWLEHNKDAPMLNVYLTWTSHHFYETPKSFDKKSYIGGFINEDLNSYYNGIHYTDKYVQQLIQQYKDMGLYDKTLFVILGDHGEGFREHGPVAHNNVVHNEGLLIPLILHSQRFRESPQLYNNVVSQIDLLPTIIDLLGMEWETEPLGHSIMKDREEQRIAYSACFDELRCIVRTDLQYRYIYNYGLVEDELYDLVADPKEKRNLIDQRAELIPERKRDLFHWYNSAQSRYHNFAVKINPQYSENVADTVSALKNAPGTE